MRFPGLASGRGPRLTVCIPAYRAGRFIERTVDSVRTQSFRDWRIVIANDGGHDREAIDRLGGIPNLDIVHHEARLGWRENANWLIRRVRTPYFAILPHDDEILPDYYAAMLDLLEGRPNAFCACSAIQTVGLAEDRVVSWKPVTGTQMERIEQVLTGAWEAVGFRAVNRRVGDNRALTIPATRSGDMFADSAWTMRQALRGDMLFDTRPLYVKHFHDANTHMGWYSEDPGTIARAWYVYCLKMGWLASLAVRSGEERSRIRLLAMRRVFGTGGAGRPANIRRVVDEAWSEDRQAALKIRFRETLRRAVRMRGLRRWGFLPPGLCGW